MKLQKIALVLILHFIPLLTYAQVRTLHVISFIATGDRAIGSHLEITEEFINKWVNEVKRQLSAHQEVRVKQYNYCGNRFQFDELISFINEYQPQQDDATLFWFVGNGFKDDFHSTPNVLVSPYGANNANDLFQNSINLQEIYSALANRTDFFWMIGDACNADTSLVEQANKIQSNKLKESGLKEITAPIGLTTSYKNYFDLFFMTQQQHLFFHIKRGQPTYSSTNNGSLYSYAFLQAINKEMEGMKLLDTKLLNNAIKRMYESLLTETVEAIAIDHKGNLNIKIVENPGFFKRLVLYMFQGKAGRKLRRKYKTVLENGNLDELSNIIPHSKANGGEPPELITFLKDRPTAYYMTRGIFLEYNAETRQDSAYVGECFCTAKELISQGFTTSSEYLVLKKIRKYNEASGDPIGIEQNGGLYKWLQLKCYSYKKFFETKLESEEYQIKKMQETRLVFEDSLLKSISDRIALREEVLNIQDSIQANQEVIETVDMQWANENYETSYVINKIPLNAAERECLNNAVDKLQRGVPLISDCEEIFAQYVKVTKKLNKGKAINAYSRAIAAGYSLGKYCDNTIVSATEVILQPLVEAVKKVPVNYRLRLKVGLQITGYADTRHCKDCQFRGLETKNYTYTDAKGNFKNFSTKNGKRQTITNEELALARALCAQMSAKRLLNAVGVSDIEYELIAVVDEVDAISSKGASFAFVIENQFLHHKDRINELTQTNIELQQRLNNQNKKLDALQHGINIAEEKLMETEISIQNTTETLFQIREDIMALEKNNIKQNLLRILRVRGLSRQEAEAFLNN